jgi:L-aminopeptidase/D-esterase-like protein
MKLRWSPALQWRLMVAAAFDVVPGPRNLITDVPGIRVGNAARAAVRSGTTVLLCEGSVAAAADVRGGGPGTRETEALAPENLVGRADAIVLTGGSALGLAAADSVAARLSAAKVGLALHPGAPVVPIVPAAVIYDLANGGDKTWNETPPYRDLGAEACAAAGLDFALGRAGAGTGARAGLVDGGLGSASLQLADGLTVGALMVVNPVGSVLMPDGRSFWAWPWEIDGEFGGIRPEPTVHMRDPLPALGRLEQGGKLIAGGNTTIGVVAVSANCTTAECKRLAMMAQDGLARAVVPAHTPFDGDVLFCVATGGVDIGTGRERQVRIAAIGSALANCVARAIARGVFESRSATA